MKRDPLKPTTLRDEEIGTHSALSRRSALWRGWKRHSGRARDGTRRGRARRQGQRSDFRLWPPPPRL
jgi:hypothetical protein